MVSPLESSNCTNNNDDLVSKLANIFVYKVAYNFASKIILYIYHSFMLTKYARIRVRFMVCNVTFNNISVISCRSVLLLEETGENHRPTVSH